MPFDAGQLIRDFLYDNPLLWAGVSAILAADALVLLAQTAAKSRKREWISFWYLLLCVAVFVWSACTALHYFAAWYPGLGEVWADRFGALRYLGYFFAPAFLCLHVWKQVSYRELRWYIPAGYLAAPVLLGGWVVWQVLGPARLAVMQMFTGLVAVVFYLYLGAMVLNCLTFLLSVFYQMPTHMRKSARTMMIGVLAFAAAVALQALLSMPLPFDLVLIAAVVLLHILQSALRTVNADNVIVTSRELVLQNLSTMVLVINRHGHVMDWNLKDGGSHTCLPQPRYRETLARYRERMLAEGGRESAHDDSIITFAHGGGESHYHLTARELYGEKRMLGYLVEISDITRVYDVLRKLEETATIDQLTGLYNRNAYLAQAIPMASRQNMPLLVMVGDVNNLKPMNDTLGHLAGDALLTSVAQIIREHMPAGAFAARIGGDEFVVLAPGCGEETAKAFLAASEQACRALPSAAGYQPGVSWGYAVMHSVSEDYNAVFAAADVMMYQSKKQRARFRSSGLVPEEAPPPVPPKAVSPAAEGAGAQAGS